MLTCAQDAYKCVEIRLTILASETSMNMKDLLFNSNPMESVEIVNS